MVTAHRKAQKVKVSKQLVSHRLGQGPFRDAVLQRYQSTCIVSKCTVPEVLEAAHIDPVSKGGSHDMNNAVLLRCDIHNLFDMGLLTIGKSGRIRVSPELRKTEYGRYHGKSIHVPNGVMSKKILNGLGRHQLLHTL
jgi:putative restriction endonuclease